MWPQALTAAAAAAQAAGSFFGGGSEGLSRDDQRFLADFSWKQSLRNEDFQELLARQGVRLRVRDAEAAGLHPLAALGVNPSSGGFSSQVFGGSPQSRDSRLGSGLRGIGQAGQDISRALMAGSTPEEKQFKQLQLQKLATENEILNTELAERKRNLLGGSSIGMPGSNAGYVIPGQGNSSPTMVQPMPLKPTYSEPGSSEREVGSITDVGLARTKYGYAPVPSKDVKERIEDQIIPELMWSARNNLLPSINHRYATHLDPKRFPLPKGYDRWEFITHLQEYRPVRGPRPGLLHGDTSNYFIYGRD